MQIKKMFKKITILMKCLTFIGILNCNRLQFNKSENRITFTYLPKRFYFFLQKNIN